LQLIVELNLLEQKSMTDRMKSIILHFIPIRWLIPVLVFGCAPIYQYSAPTAFPSYSPETIIAEISRHEEALVSESDPKERADHLWKLAILYAHPDNPHPDYKNAAARMEALSELSPNEPDGEMIHYLSGLFGALDSATSEMNRLKANTNELKSNFKKTLLDISKTKAANSRKFKEESEHYQNEIERLNQINTELEKKVAALEEKLETLKQLDLQMEERRRF
jgi:hypothetical protein